MADGTAAGRVRSPLDTIIASIALTNGCVVVTDNQWDFPSIVTINPMRGGP